MSLLSVRIEFLKKMKIFVTVLLSCVVAIQAAPRIVGGQDAPEGKYPYQVAIVREKTGNLMCGGSILNKRWILTAAHCLYGLEYKIRVVAGTNQLNGEDKQVYDVEFFNYHDDFNSITAVNDIGLVRVNKDIEFNDKVQPIALPSEDFSKIDYPVTLTGFGRLNYGGKLPETLQEITLKVIDQEVCRKAWEFEIDITKSHICTLTKSGEGSCNGDSGGPLVADGVQIGIVSFGFECAQNVPDVFTRVYTFTKWIEDQIVEYESAP